jgi:hypothetical protein
MGIHHAVLPEIGEMLRDFNLGCAEDLLKVANAKRATSQEMQDAEAGLVAEALVDFD